MGSKLLSNIRFWILSFSILLSIGIYQWAIFTYPVGSLQNIRITQLFGFTSIIYLYLTLLAGPLCFVWKRLPFRGKYLKARRALGVSVFYFGCLHGLNAFFRQLGGFEGLPYLSSRFVLGIGVSFSALIMLFLMTVTSSDRMIKFMTFTKWKLLHRLIYVSGFLLLLHLLMLGSHFVDLSGVIPTVFFLCLCFLLVLEALRIDAWMNQRYNLEIRTGPVTISIIALSAALFLYLSLPGSKNTPIGMHSDHSQNREDSSMDMSPALKVYMPGMQGDPSKRYSVSFLHPDVIESNKIVPLSFRIADAANGNEILFLQTPYEKPMHLIIVDNNLEYFQHLHPQLEAEKGYSLNYSFPHDGMYRLYADFQPFGAREQQFAFSISVGNSTSIPPVLSESYDTVKEINGYTVSFSHPESLKFADISKGKDQFIFNISRSQSHEEVKTLKPYLNAYGHLVLINAQTFEYIHVHPIDVLSPGTKTLGGPNVAFLPMGVYGSITPGIYKVFVEFHPDEAIIVPEFTVRIE